MSSLARSSNRCMVCCAVACPSVPCCAEAPGASSAAISDNSVFFISDSFKYDFLILWQRYKYFFTFTLLFSFYFVSSASSQQIKKAGNVSFSPRKLPAPLPQTHKEPVAGLFI